MFAILYFKVSLWNNTSNFLCNDIVKQLHFKNVRTSFADGISVFICFGYGQRKTKNDCSAILPSPKHDFFVQKFLNCFWLEI